MKYYEWDNLWGISDEITSAVKSSLSKLDEPELERVRDSNDNSIELSYDVRTELSIPNDIPIEKIDRDWFSPYMEHPQGRFIAQVKKGHHGVEINGSIVTVQVSVFDRTKDIIVVWDDYYGTSYCIRMAQYRSFREALDEAYKDASPDAMDWLEKEEREA